MMKSRRIEEMENYILEHNQVKIDELMEVFDVSLNTVRRDMNELVDRGTVKKVYGGVQATEIRSLIPFENRHIKEADEKRLLSEKAASFIEEDDMIFIDSGTTTQYILEYVQPTLHFTLLTNNLDVINLASNYPNIKLILIGTTYKHSTRSFVDIQHHIIDSYNISKAFMATSGFTLNSGFTNSDHTEYTIKKGIIEKATTSFVLADHTKFGKSALLTYAKLGDIDAIITTSLIPEPFKETLEQADAALIYAD